VVSRFQLGDFLHPGRDAAPSPKYPDTIHYRGDGVFMLSGANTAKFKRFFRPENL